jgi:hypothetical protein
MSPRTLAGFSVAQFLIEERRERDVRLPQRLVDTALVEQLLNVTLTKGKW